MSSLRRLVAASNGGVTPSSRFLSCPWPQPLQLSTTSRLSLKIPAKLSTWILLGLTGNGSWSSSYSLSMEHTKTPLPILACTSVVASVWWLLSHCLAMGVFTEPFPSNGCLYWLHNFGCQQTYHISPSLRLFILSSLQAYHHFFLSEGMCLWLVYLS
jgi:hypothetical protein